jgi:hypothetical protein
VSKSCRSSYHGKDGTSSTLSGLQDGTIYEYIVFGTAKGTGGKSLTGAQCLVFVAAFKKAAPCKQRYFTCKGRKLLHPISPVFSPDGWLTGFSESYRLDGLATNIVSTLQRPDTGHQCVQEVLPPGASNRTSGPPHVVGMSAAYFNEEQKA